MKFKYDEIKKFLENYFKDYSDYAQDVETMHRLNEYWDPEVIAKAYMKLATGEYPIICHNREAWQNFLIEGHRKILETLVPKEIIIDTVEMKAATTLEVQKYDRETKKPICNFDGIGFYKLIIDNNDTLKIVSIDFFCGDPRGFTSLYKI